MRMARWCSARSVPAPGWGSTCCSSAIRRGRRKSRTVSSSRRRSGARPGQLRSDGDGDTLSPVKYFAAVVCAAILYGQGATPAGEALWVTANGWRLKTEVYRSVKSSGPPVLVVVLHGDLLGVRAVPRATYHYEFARDAATKIDNLVVAALLRPGYRDHTGARYDGPHGTSADA